MEELFAHNLHSEDKGLNQLEAICSNCSLQQKSKTDRIMKSASTTWQIAYVVGSKASSRKIPQDTFL